jgi:hypothetical protein
MSTKRLQTSNDRKFSKVARRELIERKNKHPMHSITLLDSCTPKLIKQQTFQVIYQEKCEGLENKIQIL